MSAVFLGFMCALLMAALVVAWITYCMFFREKHKSELNQYDIGDLHHHRSQEPSEEPELKKKNKKDIVAGIFILPSRKHRKDETYDKRPDYPESPVPIVHSGADELIKVFNDETLEAGAGGIDKEYCYEIDSGSHYHSDV